VILTDVHARLLLLAELMARLKSELVIVLGG
jgi:hypothetical protein